MPEFEHGGHREEASGFPAGVHDNTRNFNVADLLALRLLQLEQGKDGREMAKAIGVSAGTYFVLRRGQGNPRLRTIEKIADKLGMSFVTLFGFHPEELRAALARLGVAYCALAALPPGVVSAQLLALRLRQLEDGRPPHDLRLALGLSAGTYYALSRAQGNPTLRTMEKIASSFGTSLFGLFGFNAEDLRIALARVGIDFDTLASAMSDKISANDRIYDSALRSKAGAPAAPRSPGR